MNSLKKAALVVTMIVLTLGFSSSGAFAQCKAFPNYSLWKTLTHERAIGYVDRKLKGDWQPYITHLRKQIGNIERIVVSGKSARLKHKGKVVILKGKGLDEYLRLSEKRLDVVQCLAEQQEIASLNNFATAAGGPADDEEQETEVSATTPSRLPGSNLLKLAVSTSCSNGVSKFRIKNEGPDWPKASAFSLYRIEGTKKYPVSARRMRLKKGQVASFTVKKSRNPSGNLGLFVGPSWYQRAFAYDATLICR